MAKHVLACDCGRTLEVDTAQAGGTITCECGKTIAVPTLRQLRELPLSVAEKPTTAATTWGAKQGVMTACAIVAVLSLIVAAYSRMTQPELPRFDSTMYTQQAGELIDHLTPIKAWERWVNYYRPLSSMGFQEFHHPMANAIEQEVDRRELVQMAMVGIAGIALVIAAAFGVMKKGSQRAKEPRRI